MHGPNRELALNRYGRHAAGYDASAARTAMLRARTIGRLGLRPGETVLDVGAGTGLSIEALVRGVGTGGRVVAVEQSPEMAARARARLLAARWGNVSLIEASVEDAALPAQIDAVLFHYTHDVLRSPAALGNILSRVRPGARVALAGMRFVSWWLAPVNFYVMLKGRPYLTTYEGLRRPWGLLEAHLERFETETTLMGTGYIGWGKLRREP